MKKLLVLISLLAGLANAGEQKPALWTDAEWHFVGYFLLVVWFLIQIAMAVRLIRQGS